MLWSFIMCSYLSYYSFIVDCRADAMLRLCVGCGAWCRAATQQANYQTNFSIRAESGFRIEAFNAASGIRNASGMLSLMLLQKWCRIEEFYLMLVQKCCLIKNIWCCFRNAVLLKIFDASLEMCLEKHVCFFHMFASV